MFNFFNKVTLKIRIFKHLDKRDDFYFFWEDPIDFTFNFNLYKERLDTKLR